MGDVHRMPTARDASVRLLERLVAEAIGTHPDARVAARWAAMARASVARHPGPPLPTRPVLDLGGARGLSVEARRSVTRAAEAWLASYFEDVRAELLGMQREMLGLQKRVAELEVELEDVRPGGRPGGRPDGPPDGEPDAPPRP